MRSTRLARLIAAVLLALVIVCGWDSGQASTLETLQQAAEQGDAEAQFKLGVLYNFGEGVLQDKRTAAKWFRLAADQGLAKAQFKLGVLYDLGEGVLQDTRTAAKWFRLAADQGLAEAQFNLGVLYAVGEGVLQDKRAAAKWYRLAADQGLADAQFNLGVLYAVGEGVPQDQRAAAKWFRLAAEQGHAKAQFLLGRMYSRGEGVLQDKRAAAKWYRLAAEQGHAKAQFLLGRMYSRGEGMFQDYSEAYIWFSLGAVNGDEDALKARDDIAWSLSPSELRAAQAEARRRLQTIDSRLASKTDEQPSPEYHPPPLTPITPPAQQQTAAQLAFEHGWRSVVVIHTADGQGSGVIIRPNVVATNCHVVDDDSDIVVYKADNRRARTDAPHSASISRAARERDLCLLSVSGLWGVPAQIREASSLSIGEQVYAIGTPRGLDYSLSAGVVSQLRSDADDAPVIQTDATVSPGSSGGGLFDAKGNLVGITTEKISDGEITFAIPTEWILDLE